MKILDKYLDKYCGFYGPLHIGSDMGMDGKFYGLRLGPIIIGFLDKYWAERMLKDDKDN